MDEKLEKQNKDTTKSGKAKTFLKLNRPHNWLDEALKRAIYHLRGYFVTFFLSDIFPKLDSNKSIEYATDIVIHVPLEITDKGSRKVDIMLKVHLLDETNPIFYCFIELQNYIGTSKDNSNIERRLLENIVRTFSSFISRQNYFFVLFTGSTQKVDSHTIAVKDTKVSTSYRAVHVKDYNIDKLKTNDNPFARIIHACILADSDLDCPSKRRKSMPATFLKSQTFFTII